jgi:hypothetical protein
MATSATNSRYAAAAVPDERAAVADRGDDGSYRRICSACSHSEPQPVRRVHQRQRADPSRPSSVHGLRSRPSMCP